MNNKDPLIWNCWVLSTQETSERERERPVRERPEGDQSEATCQKSRWTGHVMRIKASCTRMGKTGWRRMVQMYTNGQGGLEKNDTKAVVALLVCRSWQHVQPIQLGHHVQEWARWVVEE